jgi:hypothetical protein
MTLLSLVLTLVVIGGLLWLLNTYGGQFIDGKVLTIINVVVIIVLILWLLTVFGLLPMADMPVPRVR